MDGLNNPHFNNIQLLTYTELLMFAGLPWFRL